MTQRNKEELAKILAAMAEGRRLEETEAAGDADAVHRADEPDLPHTLPDAATSSSAALGSGQNEAATAAQARFFVQTLGFKRTIIPVLLTVGLICLGLVLLGCLAGPASPYAILGQPWFSVPCLIMGLLMLALGVMTMLQVRSELISQHRRRGPDA